MTPPSVTVATQEGEAELPQFLLLLAGALDGPAGEALSVESPVVIAPEVSNAVIATQVSLLSSGFLYLVVPELSSSFIRTPSSVSVADEATLKDLTSNLGIVCNFTSALCRSRSCPGVLGPSTVEERPRKSKWGERTR